MAATEAIFSQDAEEAVLGALLIDPSIFTTLSGILSTDDLFIVRHRHIWDAVSAIDGRGEPVDFVTVQAELKARGTFEAVGGAGYLLGLINSTPTSAHAEVYAALVKRAAVRRQLLEASDAIRRLAGDDTLPTEEVLEKAGARLSDVASLSGGRIERMSDLVNAHMERTERAMEHPGMLVGVPSLLPGLNTALGGYQPDRVYYVAARPGVGKTSFLVCEALHMAQRGYRVMFASIEMGKRDLMSSLLAVASGVPAKAIGEATMTPAQYSAYVKAAGDISKLPIFIDDRKATPRQLTIRARQVAYQSGLDVLMVDYIQMMTAPAGTPDGDYERVTAISLALSDLSKSLNVAVIAAAQLSRQNEQRAEKRPVLSDLRGSGQLEQDASVVLFPFRPNMYEEGDTPAPEYEDAEIAIAKNRYGPTGMVRCAFRPVLKQFVPARNIPSPARNSGSARP